MNGRTRAVDALCSSLGLCHDELAAAVSHEKGHQRSHDGKSQADCPRHLALWSKDGTSTTAGWLGYTSSRRSSLSNDLPHRRRAIRALRWRCHEQ